MTIERDDQQKSQNDQTTGQPQNREPTSQAQNREPTGESQSQQPTGQEKGGCDPSSFQQQPSASSEQSVSGIADSGETLTEQVTDTETAGATGEAQAGGFVGQERKDSGEYLQEKNESEDNVEGSKNFGTNGE